MAVRASILYSSRESFYLRYCGGVACIKLESVYPEPHLFITRRMKMASDGKRTKSKVRYCTSLAKMGREDTTCLVSLTKLANQGIKFTLDHSL